jgi:excinuclease ABC subunit B
VGINLLREGLDLPEVAAVAILDADKEGFLRSATSLIQVIGRAARNVDSRVYLYGDKVTDAMAQAIDETNRRRKKQKAYNKKHNITPQTIVKNIQETLTEQIKARNTAREAIHLSEEEMEKTDMIAEIKSEMLKAAQDLNFERAAFLRDQLKELKEVPNLEVTDKKAKK